jgi:hypothetical protein
MTQKQISISGLKRLAAAVISRSLTDIEGVTCAIETRDHDRDEAMAWINGPECEAFCDMIGRDYLVVRMRAAASYRHFLERAESREKAPRKPRKRSGVLFPI